MYLWMHVEIESVRLRASRFGPFREHFITEKGCARGLLSTYMWQMHDIFLFYTRDSL